MKWQWNVTCSLSILLSLSERVDSALDVGSGMALGGVSGSGLSVDGQLGTVPEGRRRRSGPEIRELWRKAILQQILLLRMERENQKLQGNGDKHKQTIGNRNHAATQSLVIPHLFLSVISYLRGICTRPVAHAQAPRIERAEGMRLLALLPPAQKWPQEWCQPCQLYWPRKLSLAAFNCANVPFFFVIYRELSPAL